MSDAQSSPNTADPIRDAITILASTDPKEWHSKEQLHREFGALLAEYPTVLATPTPGDVGELADEIDAALNDYLTNAGDALGSRLRRTRLEETLWDNKAGIVAYLRNAARSSAVTATWQPIETAPKDGKAILIRSGNWHTVGSWNRHRGDWCISAPDYPPYRADERPIEWRPIDRPVEGSLTPEPQKPKADMRQIFSDGDNTHRRPR